MTRSATKIKSNSELFDKLVYIFLSITLVAILSLPIVQSSDRLLTSLEDDSYYYFEVCRNIVMHGKVSFDEIHLTNGFHPLWMITLIPIYSIFNKFPDLPIRVVFVIQTMMFLITLLICYSLSRQNVAKGIGIIGITLALYPGYSRIMVSGMETCLVVFIYILLIGVIVNSTIFSQPQLVSTKTYWTVGLLISLVLLARLDSILFIGLFFLAMIESFLRNRSLVRNRIASISTALILPSLILCSAYLTWNLLIFGHITPVSGSIKMDYSIIHVEPKWFLQLLRPAYAEYGFALIIGILGIILVVTKIGRKVTNYDYRRIVLITSIGYLIQILHLSLFSSWRAFWGWYFYLSIIVILIVTPFIIISILHAVGNKVRLNIEKIPSPIVIALCIMITVVSVLGHLAYYSYYLPNNNNYKYVTLRACDFIHANTGKDDIFCMGDAAGLFGYCSDRRVIQLEGLVNDFEYQNVLAEGTLNRYLINNNAQYLVAYAESDSSVISGNYHSHTRVEPSHGAYHGPRDSFIVSQADEIFREIWYRDGSSSGRKYAFIIWKL